MKNDDQHSDSHGHGPDGPIHGQDAKILPFPRGHEAPESAEVNVDGQQVSIIYLPWRHEVDGEARSAGLYYHAPDSAGFYPAPTNRDLDDLLEEMVPQLRKHLRSVSTVHDLQDG